MWRMTGIAFLIGMGLTISGCGGGTSSAQSPQSPSPSGASITISPTSAVAGSADLTLTITGTNFTGDHHNFSQAVWSVNGSNTLLATTFVRSTQLTAVIPAALVSNPITAQVFVQTGDPMGDIPLSKSNSVNFSVTSKAASAISISPSSVTLAPGGAQAFTATVTGLVNTSVTWTVQEAGGGSINGAGFYAAPVTVGFYHVVATSVEDATISGSSTITVTTSSGRFTPTGSMQNARGFHTATLLANGKVLVVGGATRADPLCDGGMASAELYDSVGGSFAASGSMAAPRYAHTATSLVNGDVLVTGGFGSGVDCEDLGEPAENSAELYDPSTGSFKGTGGMLLGRGGHTATLLMNGKVLVAGGGDQGGGPFPFYGTGSITAELYDPNTGAFASTGNMATARLGHTATLLPNGKVLIVGGVPTSGSQPTVAAEIYDPGTATFTHTASMTTARAGHTATLLQDGKVLITGGYTDFTNGQFHASSTAELYDPVAGTFSATGSMGAARFVHTATLLPNGTVLIAGGLDSTAELYDPLVGSFSATGGMETNRTGHSATLLQNGEVLVSGAVQGRSFLATAELYK